MSELNSLKIVGDGHISAGEYDNIKIIGEAQGIGRFTCNTFTITGTCNIKEEASFKKMKIVGEFLSEDVLIGENLKIVGDLTVEKDLKVSKIKVIGSSKVANNLSFNEINVVGELYVTKNCEGTILESSGKLLIDGLLSADIIKINPRNISIINEIGGCEITIKHKGINPFNKGKVRSNIIEGDKIILQNTDCKIVRGHNITILSGRNIDKVEYTGTLTIDKKSKVGEEICLKN